MEAAEQLGDTELGNGTAPAQRNEGVDVTLWTFVTRNHTVLSLWFAAAGDMPCVFAPSCCCGCIGVGSLTRRQRFFVFFFTLIASFWVTLETTAYMQSDTWSFFISALVILPAACWLRAILPTCSPKLNALFPKRCTKMLRVEEVLLASCLVFVVIRAIQHAGQSVVGAACVKFIYTWLTSMAVELITLACLYPCCRYCCGWCKCIIPSKYESYRNGA
eukprot:GGOE01001599.1.p1 GENE.GGOE01001599.1~~GGOE01001599.1.p1  ORF type:complete len:237 (+),score=28.97 GGOE01001599.1:59-712(+)